MYCYIILCRGVGVSNAAAPGSIPFATLPLPAPFHSIPFHFIPFHSISFHSISFHSISFATLPFAIPFHSISFHSIPFHSISFHSIPFHFISFHFISLAMCAYIYDILRHRVCVTIPASRTYRKQYIFQGSSVDMELSRLLQ
jgi:hypothetical protein